MQQGAGQGSMFADGRKGQQQGTPPRTPNQPAGGPGPHRVAGQVQSSLPPTPSYPMAGPGPASASGQSQGTHPRGVPTATHALADGDPGVMGPDPDPIGGMPDDGSGGATPGGAPPAAAAAAGPGGPGAGPMPVIKPEAVGYHDDPQNCQGCQYFGQDSTCAVLQMQVSPQGGCAAFEAGAGGPPADPSQGMGTADTSGGGAPDANGNPPLS